MADGVEAAADRRAVPASAMFPSVEWFRRLADLMHADRARHEHLGYIDCIAQFTVTDATAGAPWSVQVTFEEFAAVDVREVGSQLTDRADFILEATLSTWGAMIDSIAAGGGRPDLEQTLNYLSHMGSPIAVRSPDPLRRDLYFRYNQSLQEFFNASAAFRTEFAK